MAKILKNTTGSAIELEVMGLQIPASSQVTVEVEEHDNLATVDSVAELTPLINAGDIVVNDSINDLSAVEALKFILYPDAAFNIRFESDPERVNGFASKNVQAAIEEARDTASTTAAAVDDTFVFWRDGKGDGKWMKQYNNHVEDSSKAPIIVPFSGEIKYITMVNKKDNANGDIEIYKNGVLLFTWTITNSRWAKKTNGLSSVTFTADDQLAIFIEETSGTKLEKVQVALGIKYTDFLLEETSGGTL